MSFLTEYFDEYRAHPIKKTKMCYPENRWLELPGKWDDPNKRGNDDDSDSQLAWSEEETQAFIRKTMKGLRGQSAYYNHYCAHLDPAFATRPFVPRASRRAPSAGAAPQPQSSPLQPPPKLAIKDTELMKVAAELYGRDARAPPMKPLATHARILSYVRPCLYHTGLSDYQHGIARLAYELVRDDRIPRYVAHRGGRPVWGVPPEGDRQPMLDVAPFDGERVY